MYFRKNERLKANTKKSFRVKGKIDEHPVKGVALIPMGEGSFIIPINGAMRKAIKKIHGATVMLQLEEDAAPLEISGELLSCLEDDPIASAYFASLPPSHRNWYSNWVKGAKTEITKAKRIATVIKACAQKLTFSQMMRQYKEDRNFIH